MSAQRQSQSGLARAPQPRAEHPKVGVSRQIDDFSACCSAPTPFVVVGLQIDIIYEHGGYKLPLALTCGNFVEFLSAGAYTTSYASVEFNGFEPIKPYFI
jgi:diaminopimelate decarboxylase